LQHGTTIPRLGMTFTSLLATDTPSLRIPAASRAGSAFRVRRFFVVMAPRFQDRGTIDRITPGLLKIDRPPRTVFASDNSREGVGQHEEFPGVGINVADPSKLCAE